MEKQVKKTNIEEKQETGIAGETAEKPEDREESVPIPEPLIQEDEGEAEDNGTDASEALAALATELEEARDQMLRLRAEFDNYRKRTAREVERVRKTAAESLIRELLPVVDNLERAFDHAGDKSDGLAQGVEMVLKQLCGVLSAHGTEPIPALGEVFDPNVHEALSHLPSDEYAADTVMQEYERGYRMGDYVLRPAKVVVSSGPAVEKEEAGTDGGAEEDA